MGIDILTLRQELEANNYTELNLPIETIRVKRPCIAALLKHSLLPNMLYDKVFEEVDAEEYNRQKAFAPYRDPEEKTGNVLTLIKELTYGLVDEIRFTTWGFDPVKGALSQELLIAFALGKCEPFISEDFFDYTKKTLKYDATTCETAVSIRLGLAGTIVGYDIDLAAGLYRSKAKGELLTLQFEFQAGLVGRQLQKGTKR